MFYCGKSAAHSRACPDIYLSYCFFAGFSRLLRKTLSFFAFFINASHVHNTDCYYDSCKRRRNCRSGDIIKTIILAKAELKQLWQPYYRKDKSRTQKGNGLGLSTVRYILDLHEAKYDTEMKSTVFTVRSMFPQYVLVEFRFRLWYNQ